MQINGLNLDGFKNSLIDVVSNKENKINRITRAREIA